MKKTRGMLIKTAACLFIFGLVLFVSSTSYANQINITGTTWMHDGEAAKVVSCDGVDAQVGSSSQYKNSDQNGNFSLQVDCPYVNPNTTTRIGLYVQAVGCGPNKNMQGKLYYVISDENIGGSNGSNTCYKDTFSNLRLLVQ